MKREICIVKSVNEDAFILENVRNERYRVGLEYLGKLKPGAYAILSYTARRPGKDDGFEADIAGLSPIDLNVTRSF